MFRDLIPLNPPLSGGMDCDMISANHENRLHDEGWMI